MNRSSNLAGHSRQRGAVMIFAAMGISALIITASLIDLGLLYQYRRDYQKAADLAALSGAYKLLDGCNEAIGAANTSATRNLGERFDIPATVECGRWDPTPFFDSEAPPDEQRAVRVTISGSPPGFLPGIPRRNLSATATAIANSPQAQLKIRSAVATLNDGAVNALLSSLLGGNAALNVVGWQGVANADINLLQFLDALDITLSAGVANYQSLLEISEVSVGDILDAVIEVLGPDSAAGVLSNFKNGLGGVGVNVGTLTVPLGDLLALQAGAQKAGLDAVVNAFDLIRATVEIANGESPIALDAPISIPGVAGVSIRASVAEKPQFSAIGNPDLIGVNPEESPNRIYVRTAQVRALISVDLGVIGLVNDLLGVLNVLGGSVTVADNQLHIALEVGGASGWVTEHSCNHNGSKELQADSQTALARTTIGRLGAVQQANVFDSSSPFPLAAPLNILTVRLQAPQIWPLPPLSADVARVTLSANDLPVGGSDKSFAYASTLAVPEGLPEIHADDTESMYQSLSTQNILSGLVGAVGALDLSLEVLPDSLVGTILSLLGVTNLINNILSPLVSALVGSVLSPLLDPILNNLLGALGLNLAAADLGAKLSCDGGGATLVQ